MHEPNNMQQHRTDTICVGGFIFGAAVILYGLKKAGFRAVIGVGS